MKSKDYLYVAKKWKLLSIGEIRPHRFEFRKCTRDGLRMPSWNFCNVIIKRDVKLRFLSWYTFWGNGNYLSPFIKMWLRPIHARTLKVIEFHMVWKHTRFVRKAMIHFSAQTKSPHLMLRWNNPLALSEYNTPHQNQCSICMAECHGQGMLAWIFRTQWNRRRWRGKWSQEPSSRR